MHTIVTKARRKSSSFITGPYILSIGLLNLPNAHNNKEYTYLFKILVIILH